MLQEDTHPAKTDTKPVLDVDRPPLAPADAILESHSHRNGV